MLRYHDCDHDDDHHDVNHHDHHHHRSLPLYSDSPVDRRPNSRTSILMRCNW